MAYTPGSPVRQNSSTSTKPRSVDLDAGALQAELIGVRTATDADDDGVDLEVLLGTIAAAEVHRGAARCRSACGRAPCTPVRMSMFFFLKLRTTTLATSASSPGRIFGRPSRMVTCEPRSANVLANSQPMAPPPMTATRGGHVVEHQHLVAGHDRAGGLEAGDGARHRAGGEHDVRALSVDGAAVGVLHRDGAVRRRASRCRRGW